MIDSKNIRLCLLFILVSSFALAGFVSQQKGRTELPTTSQVDSDPAAIVEMTNTMKFTPDTVTIDVGQTVQWNNTSLLAHSVTGDPSQSTIEGSVQLPKGAEPFDSGMMDPKQTFKHTFNTPGIYQYFCIPHEGTKMYGWVIVTSK